MTGKVFLLVKIVVAVLVAGLAIQMLMREFGSLSAAEVAAGLSRIGWPNVVAMIVATMTAYLAVATYDAFALRYAGHRLGVRRSALSSTSVYAISNVLGFAVITGNAVRYWLFGRWGLGVRQVAIAAIVTTVVCNIALALLIGAVLLLSPQLFNNVIGLDPAWAIAMGVLLVFISGSLILVGVAGPRNLTLGRLSLQRPGSLLALHIWICLIDYVATAAVLYIPLGETLGTDFLAFIAVFSVAKLAGIASNIPGGLGVFEAVMAVSMIHAPPEALAAALIAYRVVFYLLPLAISAGALASHALFHDPKPRISDAPPSA
ncbi:MAG: UPF0104 family protein [Burkholderiales bacterium]|nr:MAG: UPF0104 family protein [Burkholderiales bacterium]